MEAPFTESHASWFAALGIFAILVILAMALVFWIFFCYCCKRLCVKAGHEPGALIWIPILNLVPLLTVAKLPIWFIILFLIPPVAFFLNIFMWWKICEARGKTGALALLWLLPPLSLIVPLYLAFSE